MFFATSRTTDTFGSPNYFEDGINLLYEVASLCINFFKLSFEKVAESNRMKLRNERRFAEQ